MPIRAIIFDVSGTLLGPSGPVAGIADLWAFCETHDIACILAANEPIHIAMLHAAGYYGKIEHTPATLRIPKPSTLYVTEPLRQLGIQPSEAIYVGNSDKTDAYCAANAKVLYIRAGWAPKPGQQYGIALASVRELLHFIDLYLLKSTPWYWTTSGTDTAGRRYSYQAVAECRSIHTSPLQEVLTEAATHVLKVDTSYNPAAAARYLPFFQSHLLASLYLSGLAQRAQVWAVMPGHLVRAQEHTVLTPFVAQASIQTRGRPAPLLMRHTDAPSSREERNTVGQAQFVTQVRTVQLSARDRDQVVGKRVLVLDDFITDGYSGEWARTLLLAAGASEVMCAAVGKFPRKNGQSFAVQVPRPETLITPFQPSALTANDFAALPVGERRTAAAQSDLLRSFTLFQQWY